MQQKNKMIGVVLDISNQPASPSGRRIIDYAQRALINFVSKLDTYDCLYIYAPELVEPICQKGKQVALIANYTTNGYKFNLFDAFKQTYYVLLTQDEDTECTLIYLTDRFEDETIPIKKLFNLDRIGKHLWEPCRVAVIGIGNQYNKTLLASLCQESKIPFLDASHDTIEAAINALFTLEG